MGLAPATVSLVLNDSPVASTIASETRAKILAAAREFNYRPNFMARSLRTGRSQTIGVLVAEVSEGYNATVLSGIEDQLLREGYFYFVASHRHRPDLIQEYTELFLDRAVDGLVVVSTPWTRTLKIPVATVSCHHTVEGTTSIVVDHRRAAELALKHLDTLGHRRIAFIKGQAFVPDTEVRWDAIVHAAEKVGVSIVPGLVTQIEQNSPKPDLGYKVTQKLLNSGEPFTALFAFNDICAIGAIRALHESGLRVPDDVSVVGFDDIDSAAYQNPALTTVRQPLKRMGMMAAQTVLKAVNKSTREGESARHESVAEVVVEPELIIRDTTCPVASVRKLPAIVHSPAPQGVVL